MTTYRIKALEWESSHEMTFAKTPFGRYEIFDYYEGNHTAFFYYGGSNYGHRLLRDKGHSMDNAKAACSDHWESLMKQALEEVCTTQHQ